MNFVKLFIALFITIPQLLFSQEQEYILAPRKERFSDEINLLKQNDFKLFETAFLKSNSVSLKKYFHTQIDTTEIRTFLNTLQISSKYVFEDHYKSEKRSLWTSSKRKIEKNIITLKSLTNQSDLAIEYTYNIIDSSLAIYTLSYFDITYEHKKVKYKKVDAIPKAYINYIEYENLYSKIKPTESLIQYEERIKNIYKECEKSGIPFTDSMKAKRDIIDKYYFMLLDLIYTSKNYSYAAKVSKRGTVLDPTNSNFMVKLVISKCLMGQYNEIKDIVPILKTMPSNVINQKNGFEQLLSSIEYLEQKGQKCKGFEYIKAM